MSVDPLDPIASVARGAPPHPARLLVAIPYRQAGLIAACALAGVAATLALSALRPPAPVAGAHARVQMQVQRPAAMPIGDAIRLQLDLEPGRDGADGEAAASMAPASSSAAALRLDDAREIDAFEDALQATPTAAGWVPTSADGRGDRPGGVVETLARRGLLAGLLLGLLLASLRELRGARMRTPREAEWALGAPVLGAIPTLSAKARAASVGMPGSA